MSTDFSGGIPLVAWSEEAYTVPFIWDPASLDNLSELLSEHTSSGGDPREVLMRALAPEIRKVVSSALRVLLLEIKKSEKPKLAVDQIAWFCGLSLREGETLGTLAKAHGISKQAFQQGAEKYRGKFRIRSQSQRTKEAKKKMSKRNYRRTKA